jgi:hypothetical protein
MPDPYREPFVCRLPAACVYSAPQSLTVTNTGHGDLQITKAQAVSADADDFLISSDSCSGNAGVERVVVRHYTLQLTEPKPRVERLPAASSQPPPSLAPATC